MTKNKKSGETLPAGEVFSAGLYNDRLWDKIEDIDSATVFESASEHVRLLEQLRWFTESGVPIDVEAALTAYGDFLFALLGEHPIKEKEEIAGT